MTVLIQRAWYTRAGLQAKPNVLFAWGDNVVRRGGANNPKSGQAFACRGEPNAVGIVTKHAPSMDPSAMFSDADHDRVVPILQRDLDRLEAHLASGGDIVWPADGIGTGRARLAEVAPRIWAYLERRRQLLFDTYGTKNI
jgi:hypothetical protein